MLHLRSFVISFFRLSLNRKRNAAVVSQEMRSKHSQTSSSTCKMQNGVCCIKKQSGFERGWERTHERCYIFYFVRYSESARTRLFKKKDTVHCDLYRGFHAPFWYRGVTWIIYHVIARAKVKQMALLSESF